MENFEDRFAIFIISHQRADNVKTVRTIERHGYTGDWFIVVDNLDDQLEDYKERYGEDTILVYDKEEIAEKFDSGDNFDDLTAPIYPRMACFELAEELGYEYFMVLDDDYEGFQYRFNSDLDYSYEPLDDLDHVLEKFAEFYEKAGAEAMTFAQGGDFIGGSENQLAEKIKIKRKAMNTWMKSPKRKFPMPGRMNNDVITYIRGQQLGRLMFMVNHVSVDQEVTQTEEGGLTELYIDKGTYVKTFYSVMYCPSCIKISMIRGQKYSRIHHKVKWDKAVPKLLSEKYRKTREGE